MQVVVNAIQGTSRFLAVISSLTMMILVFLIVVDVSSRLLGLGSIGGLLEIAEVALVFLVFSGIAYGLQARTHVAVSLLTARLPAKVGKTVVVIGLVALVALLGWAVWATGVMAYESVLRQEVRFGITRVPVWPARVIIPIGMLLLLGEVIIQLKMVITGEEKIQDEMPADEEFLV